MDIPQFVWAGGGRSGSSPWMVVVSGIVTAPDTPGGCGWAGASLGLGGGERLVFPLSSSNTTRMGGGEEGELSHAGWRQKSRLSTWPPDDPACVSTTCTQAP